jgi:catechol 2,3-dioxygenase-like lactoylglutathione lyase family enzyme
MDAAKTKKTPWKGIDHVQLAIPIGGEQVAREFYADLLGLTEVAKPAALAARGGAWFEAGATRIHVGVEAAFIPAEKAHPALVIEGLRAFIEATGLDARWSDEIPGVERCHIDDPFGNRIELIEAGDAS